MQNQQMSREELTKAALQFRSARHNLLVVVVFTVVNLILFSTGADNNFLFSAPVPQFVLYSFMLEAAVLEEAGTPNNALATIGFVAALLLTGVYFMISMLSQKVRMLILFALIFFSFETFLLFSAFLLTGNFYISDILTIAFCSWILFYLINGTRAWRKLRGFTNSELDAIYKEHANLRNGVTSRDNEPPAVTPIHGMFVPPADSHESSQHQPETHSPPADTYCPPADCGSGGCGGCD
jgi:hypothetical protein